MLARTECSPHAAVASASDPSSSSAQPPASLAVGTRALAVKAYDQTKTYGTSVTFIGTEFSISSGSLAGSDSISSVTLTGAGAAAGAAVGGYGILASVAVAGTGSASDCAVGVCQGHPHDQPRPRRPA